VFQDRQVLVRLRQSDTDRQIARSGLMGRHKLAAFRAVCQQHGWLDSTAVCRISSVKAQANRRE